MFEFRRILFASGKAADMLTIATAHVEIAETDARRTLVVMRRVAFPTFYSWKEALSGNGYIASRRLFGAVMKSKNREEALYHTEE